MHFESFDDMSIHVELKPCPFCGGKAEVNHVSLGGYQTGYDVRCPDCGCGTDYAEEKQEVITAWNTRI